MSHKAVVLFSINADIMLVVYMVSGLTPAHCAAKSFIFFETAGIFYLMFATFAGMSRLPSFSATRLIPFLPKTFSPMNITLALE